MEDCYCLLRTAGVQYKVAGALQHVLCDLPNRFLVFDQQDGPVRRILRCVRCNCIHGASPGGCDAEYQVAPARFAKCSRNASLGPS